jgi:hypothetical protein
LYFLGCGAYILYGDVEIQDWAVSDEDDNKNDKTERIELKTDIPK